MRRSPGSTSTLARREYRLGTRAMLACSFIGHKHGHSWCGSYIGSSYCRYGESFTGPNNYAVSIVVSSYVLAHCEPAYGSGPGT